MGDIKPTTAKKLRQQKRKEEKEINRIERKFSKAITKEEWLELRNLTYCGTPEVSPKGITIYTSSKNYTKYNNYRNGLRKKYLTEAEIETLTPKAESKKDDNNTMSYGLFRENFPPDEYIKDEETEPVSEVHFVFNEKKSLRD